ncbi:GNAT family protein [Bradyrhizobium sp.]|uniref:GNAT family N-acetyltransferase n=1 Tax=Bradyrhizobium sp. TaxID=376 RepID=UPI0025C354D5|nr:GNAT family protein [Bradyrhizobium sp.]
MALFRLPSSGPAALAPRGQGVLLRAPHASDFTQWVHLRESSRAYLTPWEPIWPSDDLTRAGFRRRLRRYAEDMAADRSYPFIIFREADDAMVGGITLANVRRGIVQAGTIGYWVGEPYAGRGYMTTALRVLLPTLFGELNLHRIEAACIPSNRPSIRVLEKCGFTREGLARRYLCINGVWQDHLLFGLLQEDFRG